MTNEIIIFGGKSKVSWLENHMSKRWKINSCFTCLSELDSGPLWPRSRVSTVEAGHSHYIYSFTAVPALICQHKRGRIEGMMTRDIFHCSLHFPLFPLFKVQTLFLVCEGIDQGQTGAPFWAGDILKGKRRNIAWSHTWRNQTLSIFHQCWDWIFINGVSAHNY